MKESTDNTRSQPARSLPPRWTEGLQALCAAAHEASVEKLILSSSGNISVRLTEGRFAISGAGVRLGELCPEKTLVLPVSCVLPPVEDRSAGTLRPSRETPMHRAMYEAHPRLGSLLHFQSLAATALACRPGPLPDLAFLPEIPVYLRKVASVAYHPPGSEALAAGVVEAFQDPDVRLVLLRNHGQVATGDTPAQAVERALFFEFAARIYLLSEVTAKPRTFSEEELKVLWSL